MDYLFFPPPNMARSNLTRYPHPPPPPRTCTTPPPFAPARLPVCLPPGIHPSTFQGLGLGGRDIKRGNVSSSVPRSHERLTYRGTRNAKSCELISPRSADSYRGSYRGKERAPSSSRYSRSFSGLGGGGLGGSARGLGSARFTECLPLEASDFEAGVERARERIGSELFRSRSDRDIQMTALSEVLWYIR